MIQLIGGHVVCRKMRFGWSVFALVIPIGGCMTSSGRVTTPYRPEDGWVFHDAPREITWEKDGELLLLLETDPNVSFVQVQVRRTPGNEYRPVVFVDGGKERMDVEGRGSVHMPQGGASIFGLPEGVTLAGKRVALGIEVLTPEARRRLQYRAFSQAKESGKKLLPPPEEGAPYEFELTTVEGDTLRSSALRGKVVVIDCWATWCGPCMAITPVLVSLTKEQNLVVVSVNLDDDKMEGVEKLKGMFGPATSTWKHVWVPLAERREWHMSVGTDSIPLVLVLDQQGILHSARTTQPEAVEKFIRSFLGAEGKS
jgi:thiol-disulfide isomerase/thioredoxin